MEQFIKHTGIAVAFDRANIDTDMIIPKQFLKSIKKTGYGPHLFDELRFEDEGYIGIDTAKRPLRADFVLNQPRYQGGSVLLARENFGCGSSREHAPWALLDYGFRCVIAPSFADIFYNNSFKNGLLPIVMSDEQVDALFEHVMANEGAAIEIDLLEQRVTIVGSEIAYEFEIDAFRKTCLLEGLDEIGVTLKSAPAIRFFEEMQRKESPWLDAK